MSRRDTILVAVLINAGLLVILFATAVTGDKQEVGRVVQVAEVLPAYVPPTQRTVVADEVDQMIQEYKKEIAVKDESIVEVTVKRGDTLDKIASGSGTTVDAIMKASKLENTRLQIGQVLRVPVSEVAAVIEEPKEEMYTIQSGDNPSKVAMKFHIPLDDLMKLNDLNDDKARKLRPGDQIRVK